MAKKEVNGMKEKWIKLGVVGVDSGQLVICDPCYLDDNWEIEDYNGEEGKKPKKNFSYNSVCNLTGSKKQGGQINYKLGHAGLAVATATGWGDGCYPVLAKVQHGRITEIKINFE